MAKKSGQIITFERWKKGQVKKLNFRLKLSGQHTFLQRVYFTIVPVQLEITARFHFDNAHWHGTVQDAIVDLIVAWDGDQHPLDLLRIHKEIGPITNFVT